ALAEAKLPLVRFDALAAAVYERADPLIADNRRRAKLRETILKAAAAEDIQSWMDMFLKTDYRSGAASPVEAGAKLLQVCGRGDDVLTEYHKRFDRGFIRNWQVIGPF